MLRAVLVDDEQPALKALGHLLRQYPDIEIAGMFTEFNQALDLIRNDTIHMLFLDIGMPNLSGIEAAKQILSVRTDIAVIFVTAYSHFAVEAFELNAFDYIMKPVSPARLNKTIERIRQRQPKLNGLALQQTKNDFFNIVIAKKITRPDDILQQAKLINVDFTQSFSLFFMQIFDNNQALWEPPDRKNAAVNAFIGEISERNGLQAWQTCQGIGILDYTIAAGDDCKNEELAAAADLKAVAARYFPDKLIAVGIAKRCAELEKFSDRYVQARNAAIIGVRVSPSRGIYHIADSEFLATLDQYVDAQSADTLIDSTIGKLLEHDRVTGTDLFHTLEAIVLNNNLQEVANTMFIHYKTVLFRKHTIEKILGITINSFAGRIILGMALTLYYLRNIPAIHSE